MIQSQKTPININTIPVQSSLTVGLADLKSLAELTQLQPLSPPDPAVQNEQNTSIRSPSEISLLSTTAVVGTPVTLCEAITDKFDRIKLHDSRRNETIATFIHTNESQISQTLEQIGVWSETHMRRPVVQLGVGSIVNYSFAIVSKPSVLVIADLDSRLIRFHDRLFQGLSKHEKIDQDVTEKIIARLERKSYGSSAGFKSRDTFDTSWITPEHLTHLTKMYSEGRMLFRVVNINDALEAVETVKKESKSQGIKKPKVLLYTSNVGDWICGRNTKITDTSTLQKNYAEFHHSVSKIIGTHGMLIFSTIDKISTSDGKYMQQTAQGLNGLPAFSKKPKNRSKKPALSTSTEC